MIASGLFFVLLVYLEEKHGLMHPVTIAIPVYILIILIARLILSGHVKIK